MVIDSKLIEKLKSLDKPAIIGISGFGGAGKSSTANEIAKRLQAPVICIDSFIKKDKPEVYSNWEIMDFERLLTDVIQPFKAGENPIVFRPSRWEDGGLLPEVTISHNGILVIEGVGLFQPLLLKHFSYTIWIDTPAEEAFKRGKKRDREVYNKPQDELWDGIWRDNDIQFYENYHPEKLADEVINNN